MLLITSAEWSDLEDQARAAGIRGAVAKPLFRSTLYHALTGLDGRREQAPAQEAAKPMSLEGRRVLLAEDNDLNWEIAEELLSELGLVMERAENGQICADLFAGSEPGWYSAILMDLRMPVMNGYEATEAIRAMDRPDAKTLPIIAMDEVSRLLEKYIGAVEGGRTE